MKTQEATPAKIGNLFRADRCSPQQLNCNRPRWIMQANMPGSEKPRRKMLSLRHDIGKKCLDPRSSTVDLNRLRNDWYINYGKRVFDIVIATILLVVCSPLLLIIAGLIKLDSPGPVLFLQWRTGLLGRRFRMFKMRTMVSDAETLKLSLLHLNMHTLDSPDFKLKSDPRVTRIGIYLRVTSLDELPNLINVLLGDMSLVGPRPTSFCASTYGVNDLSRLAGVPGITGLWQISGRAELNFSERVNLDVEYLNTISLKRDIGVLYRTAFKLSDGAY